MLSSVLCAPCICQPRRQRWLKMRAWSWVGGGRSLPSLGWLASLRKRDGLERGPPGLFGSLSCGNEADIASASARTS